MKSLSTKVFQLIIALVAASVILFVGTGIFQVRHFAGIMEKANREQNDVIMDTTSESMEEMAAESYRKFVVAEAKILDGEFWTMRHDLEVLAKQVEMVLENPSKYAPVEVERPSLKNAGKLTLQLLYSDRADQSDEELREQIGRVATVGNMMLEIVGGSDTLLDCTVALPGGASIMADRTPETKIGANGEYISLNTYRRPWYAGAVTHGEAYFSPVNRDSYYNTYEVMAGVPVYVDGKLAAVCGNSIQMTALEDFVASAQLGEGSHTCLINENGNVIYTSWADGELGMANNQLKSLRESSNAELVELVNEALTGKTGFSLLTLDGEETYVAYAPLETVGWTQLLTISREELNRTAHLLTQKTDSVMQDSITEMYRNQNKTIATTLIFALALLALATVTSKLFANRLVRPIEQMTKRVSEMQGGDMTFKVDDILRTGDEIEQLACSIEEMDEKLHRYIFENTAITAENERIGTELDLASRIQSDMMPSVFPRFTGSETFSIDASMHPAKEVGGDFYDFFMIDDDHLALVTADVSGKGVPAALFMMISKTLIKNEAMHGKAPAEVLRTVNEQLSENNKEGMFVTVWLGVLELSTGKLRYADAGHEKLLLCHDGKWSYVEKPRRSAAIAMLPPEMVKKMPDSPFVAGELQLMPGDALFQYTDGVTEATDAQEELFGEERLLDAMNRAPTAEPSELLPYLHGEIDAFVKAAPQFDDITMLALRLKRPGETPEKKLLGIPERELAAYLAEDPAHYAQLLYDLSERLRADTTGKKTEDLLDVLAEDDQTSHDTSYTKNIHHYSAGTVLFREGDPSDCMYDVLSGRVGIYVGYGTPEERKLTDVRANQFFGEMGMIEQAARSATAVVLEDSTRAAVIRRDDFGKLYQDDPTKAVLVLQHLAHRLNNVEQRTTGGEGQR